MSGSDTMSVRRVILIGPRASCALKIMSAQDARGPMSMIGQGCA